MRYALLALALLTTPASALDIHNDSGGNIMSYAARYRAATKPIRILGTCASACTLALRYPDTCVGPGAKLIFHAVSGVGKHNRAFTRMVHKYYRAPIRRWLAGRTGVVVLQGKELSRVVRRCVS